MKSLFSIGSGIVLGIMLLSVGLGWLLIETNRTLTYTSPDVKTGQFVTSTYIEDIKKEYYIDGSQIVGMAEKASSGEYILLVDGISVRDKSDLDFINFRGVVEGVYKITSSINQQTGSVEYVIATRE